MSWIESIQPEAAGEDLRKFYRRLVGERRQIDRVLSVHALKPHTLQGHLALYRAAMHDRVLELPLWLREAIGIFVSRLNRCGYCVAHHRRGMHEALADREFYQALDRALARPLPEAPLTKQQQAIFPYVRKLTVFPSEVDEQAIDRLRKAGYSDGEILEINQIAGYFAYVNRVVLGLGVELEPEYREFADPAA